MNNVKNSPDLLSKSLRKLPTETKKDFVWLLRHPEFEEKPICVREFIDSPDFLGLGDQCRRRLKNELEKIFGTEKELEKMLNSKIESKKLGMVNYALFTGGIGIGKTFITGVAFSYMIYRLLILKNPQRYYDLAPGTRIAIMEMSTSGHQALNVIFSEIKARVENCPWFMRYYPYDPNYSNQLRFKKNVFVIPGDSQETTFEGYNIIAGAIDELDSHKKTATKDYAQVGFETIDVRITSRFHKNGLLFLLGSMKSATGSANYYYYLLRKRTDANVSRLTIWDSRNKEDFCGKKFYFDVNDKKIVTEEIGNVIKIPEEYRNDFKSNPDKALRDLAGIPPYAQQPFFSMADKVKNGFSDYSNPVNEHGGLLESFRATDDKKRIIHVDLGINKDGGDACFVGETEILNENSEPTQIKNIQIGDNVIGNNGLIGKVVNIVEYRKNNLCEIKCCGNGIVSTDDHKYLVLRKKKITYCGKVAKPYTKNKKFINKFYNFDQLVEYVEVKDIEPGDYLCSPVVKNKNDNYDLDWLLGIYLAEGDIYNRNGKNCVRFSLNINEDWIADKINNICYRIFGRKSYVTKLIKRNVLTVRCHGIGDWFLDNGSKYCDRKRIKNIADVGIGVVHGVIDGDGWKTFRRFRSEIGLKTTSKNLAYQIKTILIRYGFAPQLYTEKKIGRLMAHRIVLHGRQALRYIGKDGTDKGTYSFNFGKYSFYRVNNIKLFKKSRTVYDLTIDGTNSSYNVLGFIVHNCGIAMGHIEDFKSIEGDQKPIIKIDFMAELKAPPGGEIMISDIRLLIYELIDRGFKIVRVTYDGWQSAESLQALRKRRIPARILSIDKDTAPYESLKEALYEKRLKYPRYLPFIDECIQLEYIEGGKIDHPPKGKKDVSDAVAGVVFNLVTSSIARPHVLMKSSLGEKSLLAKVGGINAPQEIKL